MQLNSKTDKAIKRYLKSISDSVKESKVYSSVHYDFNIGDTVVDIRFSNHISSHNKTTLLDIIKTGENTYYVQFYDSVSANKTSDEVLPYIKSLISVGASIVEIVNILKTDIKQKRKDYDKVCNKANTFSQIIENKDKTIDNLRNELKTLKSANNIANNTIQSLNSKISKMEVEQGKLIQNVKKAIGLI